MAQGAGTKSREAIGQWSLPTRGIWRNVPASRVPPDALRDGLNAIIKDGTVQTRPGLTQLAATALTTSPTGANFYISANGTQIFLVGTTTKIWKFEASTWADITGTALTASRNQLARWALMSIGTPAETIAFHVNGKDVMRKWKKGDATTSVIGGANPPPAGLKDIAAVSDRLVGIIHPYEIRWTPTLKPEEWQSLNVKFANESTGPLRAVRSLQVFGVAVYKSDGVLVGYPQGGSDAQAFRWAYKRFDGPAGAGAVVETDSFHYFFTESGRIGTFDGVRREWIADTIWPDMRKKVDPAFIDRTFGWWDPILNIVYFAYPRLGDSGLCKGGVIIMVPDPVSGIRTHAPIHAEFGKALSAAMDVAGVPTSLLPDPLVFADTPDDRSLKFTGSDDAGTTINANIRTGLLPLGNLDPNRVVGIELFCERGGGFGTATLEPVTSNVLDNPDGTLGTSVSVDLTVVQVKDIEGFSQARGRFLGFKLSWTGAATLRYQGAIPYGRQVS